MWPRAVSEVGGGPDEDGLSIYHTGACAAKTCDFNLKAMESHRNVFPFNLMCIY